MQSSRAIVFLAFLELSMANLTAVPFQKSIEDKEPEFQKAIMQQNVSKRTDSLSGEALKINEKSTDKCFLVELIKCLFQNANFTIKKIQHKDYLIIKRKNENNNKTCISATENSIIERVYHTTPTPSINFVTEYQAANTNHPRRYFKKSKKGHFARTVKILTKPLTPSATVPNKKIKSKKGDFARTVKILTKPLTPSATHHLIPNVRITNNEIDTGRNKHDLFDGLKFVKIGQDTEEVQDVPKINKIGHNTWRPYGSYAQPNEITHKARGVTFPGLNRMSKFLSHETKYPNTLSHTVRNPGGASILTPYPYMRNSENKNVIFQTDIGKSSSLVSKPIPQIDNTEFSDEMKRELRDGKVILLSGNVVRSNFEPEKEKNEGGKETKQIPPEVGPPEEEKEVWQHMPL